MTRTDAEEDLRIIAAIKESDQTAFAQLYDRHSDWLMAVAYRILGNQQDAEDLLHDVFLEIWHKANSFDSQRGTLKSWLAVKTRSRALDRLRALNTVKKHIDNKDSSEIEMIKPANNNALNNDHQQAVRLMQKLSTTQRTVIELSYFRGYSCQEIANYCQLPLGTVKSGIQRGIQALRQQLKSQENKS